LAAHSSSVGRGAVGRILIASRVGEQVVVGGGSVLLAQRLNPVDFAPVSALFLASSVALTIGDLGAGLALLRLPDGQKLQISAIRRCDIVSALVTLLAVAASAIRVMDTRTAIAIGAIWAVGTRSTVSKAAALRGGAGRLRVAKGELLGAACAAVLILSFGFGDSATSAVGVALCAKSGMEIWFTRNQLGEWASRAGTVAPPPLSMVAGQVTSYASSNVDYLLVAGTQGAAAFSIYSLAFRITSAAPAVLGVVLNRLLLADLATSPSPKDSYVHRRRNLMTVGAVAAGLTVAASPALPLILGPEWRAGVPVLAFLAVSIPWRTVIGTATVLMIYDGRESDLLHLELKRLLLTVVALLPLALAGLPLFTIGVSAISIVAGSHFVRTAERFRGK